MAWRTLRCNYCNAESDGHVVLLYSIRHDPGCPGCSGIPDIKVQTGHEYRPAEEASNEYHSKQRPS